jgi:hypothetical protein
MVAKLRLHAAARGDMSGVEDKPEVTGTEPSDANDPQRTLQAHGTGYLTLLVGGPFQEHQMDWSETMRKAVILAEANVTFDELNQILPPNLRSEDIESLMLALSDQGIWIQEESGVSVGGF